VTIQVVVVQELSTRSYIGCPNDSKKIPDAIEGKEAVCPKCGNIVKPKVLQWALYLVGDSTDEIIASFPPSIMNRPTERMVIVARGLLGENEEFLVYRWSLPSESGKTIAPTDQTLAPFFKPIATNSPTNGPSMATNGPSMATPMVGIGQKSAPAPVIELDSRPAGGTSTNRPTIAPNALTIASHALPSNNPLVCNECGTGPFDNQLKLQSHKTTAHPVKKARRKKAMADLTASAAPIPTASTSTPLTASAVIPPVPTPIPFTASPEQATLPTTSDVKPSQTTEAQVPTPTTPALHLS